MTPEANVGSLFGDLPQTECIKSTEYRGLGAWLGNYVAPPDPPKEDDTDEHEPFTEVTEGE